MRKICLIASFGIKITRCISYLDSIFDELVDYSPSVYVRNNSVSEYKQPEAMIKNEFYEPTEKELQDYDKVKVSNSQSVLFEDVRPYSDAELPDKLLDLKEYIESFHEKLLSFMKTNVNVTFSGTYSQGCDKVKRILKLIDKNLEIQKEIFPQEIDNECLGMLDNLFFKYKPHLNVSDYIYEYFSKDLDQIIYYLTSLKFVSQKSLNQNGYQKRSKLLLNEYMHIYKYVTLIPEILSLGYVRVTKPSAKILIIVHLLKLCITKKEFCLQEKGVFVIFFIIKALSFTSKNKTNFIEALKLQENLCGGNPELHFFIWEFKFQQRMTLKQRINLNKKKQLQLNQNDLIYYNLVLKIFLLQHLIFLKFHNFEYKDYKDFLIFFDETLYSNDCFGCRFKRFMDLAETHLQICNSRFRIE